MASFFRYQLGFCSSPILNKNLGRESVFEYLMLMRIMVRTRSLLGLKMHFGGVILPSWRAAPMTRLITMSG